MLRPKRLGSSILIDLNASAAARRAGYSANNANVVGSRLLANVDVPQPSGRAARHLRGAGVARLLQGSGGSRSVGEDYTTPSPAPRDIAPAPRRRRRIAGFVS